MQILRGNHRHYKSVAGTYNKQKGNDDKGHKREMKGACKRRYRSTRIKLLILSILGLLAFSFLRKGPNNELDLTKRHLGNINQDIEAKLREQLKLDKGTGCEMPELDPFAREVTQFDEDLPKIVCMGQDWVKCNFSECKVIKEILYNYPDVSCIYKDIIFVSDTSYTIGAPVEVEGSRVYHLKKSDHVKISCKGTHKQSNGFIRKMPKSYKFLTEELKATILKGYNIVGDGTPAALFPILTGNNEVEMPDARKGMGKISVDMLPFIFYKLKDDGYRTSFLEDSPSIGTFQFRLNGFRHQPTDHYLRAFFLEEQSSRFITSSWSWWKSSSKYCVGDTPRYKLMMDLTNQFLHLDGKKFAFTFIVDITHNNFNQIHSADEDFVHFLTKFRSDGFLRDTMLLVMGDHGPRYTHVRNTYQGKLEERLPLMAITLPEKLTAQRPSTAQALRLNAGALTTPHDIHATILDAMDLRRYWNEYKVTGADLPRGMTLFEPIPRNRSCSEAGIEPHWCACLSWQSVSESDPMYRRAGEALVDHINSLTKPFRAKCLVRTLSALWWVKKQLANSRLLSFVEALDKDGYVGKFGKQIRLQQETYQAKITVGPGKGFFEASMTYYVDDDVFHVDNRDISRTNMYGSESACIREIVPHLNPYCYCVG